MFSMKDFVKPEEKPKEGRPDSGGILRNSMLLPSTLRMVAWEVTRSCNLACLHCRASSVHGPYAGELSTDECLKLVDEIAALGSPVIILTGGEPLLREDIYTCLLYPSAAADDLLCLALGGSRTIKTHTPSYKSNTPNH